MSYEETEPKAQEIIFKSQLWLDIRWYLAIAILLAIGYILRTFFGVYIPIRILGSVSIGLVAGLGIGYYTYNPYGLIELDVREYPSLIGITLYPKHLRQPPNDVNMIKTMTRVGSDVVVLSDIPSNDVSELRVTIDGYKKLAKRYETTLHRLRVLERELEIKAMEKARNVLRDYLEARKKLLEEWKGEANE